MLRAYGGSGITARLEPATIDGLVYASSMVILYAARHTGFTSTEVVYGVTGTEVTELPEYGVSP